MRLKSYEKYKTTDNEWLGVSPEHWVIKRVKDVTAINKKALSEKTDKKYTFKYIDIGNVNVGGIISEPEITDFESAPSRARRIVCKNDVIVSTVRTYLKAVAFFDEEQKDVIVSTGFAVLSHYKNINPVYLGYLVKSETFIDNVIRFSVGVSYPAINTSTLASLFIFNPPNSEQEKIANFLNKKTTAIDKKISLLENKITYYSDLCKSIINDAVCRGLKKNVDLKKSRIEWIDQIPKHWEEQRLKDLTSLKFSNVNKLASEGQQNVLLCNYTDVYKNKFITGSIEFMQSTASIAEIKKFTLKKGDILITKDSETADDIAVPALVTENLCNVICGYHLAMIRTKNKLISPYLFYLFQSSLYNHIFARQAKGITRVGLSINSFNDAFVFVPPIEEQIAIAEYLDTKTKIINSIVTNITTQIVGLKELRKTLINDLVTGKLRVAE